MENEKDMLKEESAQGLNTDDAANETVENAAATVAENSVEAAAENTFEAAAENSAEAAAAPAAEALAIEEVPETFEPAVPKKSNKGRIIALVAVVAVIAIAAAVVTSFGSAHNMIMQAAEKTFALNDGPVAQMLKAPIMSEKDINMTMNGDFGGIKFKAEANENLNEKLTSMNLMLNFNGIEVGADVFLDDKVFQMEIPLVSDKVLTYDYTDENKDGYFETLLQSSGMSYESLDAIFNSAYSEDNINNKYYEDFKNVTVEHIKAMKFEKTDARDFTISGETVACKGYKATLTAKDMQDWIKDYKEIVTTYYAAFEQGLSNYNGTSGSYSEAFDSIINNLEGAADMDVTFYIKGGMFSADQLAAIECSKGNENSVIGIYFEGGDSPAQNGRFEITQEGEEATALTWTGTTKDGVSDCEVAVNGEMLFALSYKAEDGSYSFKLENGTAVNGKLIVEDEKFTFTVDEVTNSDMPLSFECIITKGAKEIKALEGDVFDLCHADEADWQAFFNEAQGKILSNPQVIGAMMGAGNM
ncbi:MAG: hypothetical protein K6F52_00080 [Clostridia bacterium]|nr:hypothetical protein [Clostridia bacterium]